MNTGSRPAEPTEGLLSTVGWQIGTDVRYVLEGSVFVSGAVIQWLRDGLGLIRTAAESEEVARQVSDNGGVYLVPAFVGLGAPYWDPYARGTIQGLTRGAGRAHIVRAALESMAYQTADVLQVMRREAGLATPLLRVDGGASANNFLLQFQADVLGLPLVRPACVETTALGAANLAGLAVGMFSSIEEIAAEWKVDCRMEPSLEEEARQALLSGWHRAVERSFDWAKG